MLLEAHASQAGGEAVHALRKLEVAIVSVTLDHRRLVGKYQGAAVEETDRRKFGSVDFLFHVIATPCPTSAGLIAMILFC